MHKNVGARFIVPPCANSQSTCDLNLFFFGYVDRDLRGDVAEDFDGNGIFAEGLDRIDEICFPALKTIDDSSASCKSW
jgi:hypothetical protein